MTSVLAVSIGLAAASSASATAIEPYITSATAQANGVLALGYDALVYLEANGNPLGTSTYTSDVSGTTITSTDVTAEMATWNAYSDATTDATQETELGDAFDGVAGAANETDLTGENYSDLIGTTGLLTLASANLPDLTELTQLFTYDPTDYANGLYSVDNDLAVSSTATVTSANTPSLYTLSVATTSSVTDGYVLPSQFTFTIPSDYGVNTALVGHEIQASDETDPSSAAAIGTFTIDSPAAAQYGLNAPGTLNVVKGSVYVVSYPSATQPSFELYFGSGIYMLGSFPSSLAFPLTVTFGEVQLSSTLSDPLPISSLTMTFPAATGPLKPTSCSSLGAVTGTATDNVASLAALDGDANDGYSASGNTAVMLAYTNTAVTDNCAAVASKAKFTIAKKTKKVSFGVTLAGNAGNKFKSAMLTFPKGITYKGKSSYKASFGATGKKSFSLSGVKLTKKEAKAKSATIKYTVVYSSNGGTSGAGSVKAKL